MYDVAARSVMPKRLAKTSGVTSLMYSDSVIPAFLHDPCRHIKSDAHEPFSEGVARPMHNSCMAKPKQEKDAISIEMGKRLAKCRKSRGWSQAELAAQTGWTQEDADEGRAAGFSPSRIGNYEQGSRRFSNEEAELFGRVFDLPTSWYSSMSARPM